MFTKFSLRPSSPFLIPLSPPFTPFFTIVSTRRIAVVSAAVSSSVAVNQTSTYGPTLSNGYSPSIDPKLSDSEEELFDESSFTRVFDISALRVTAERCFVLENQLRGHLLNWPRIRNIARVSGDEIDPQLQKYFNSSNDQSLDTLNRRIYGKAEGDGERLSPVLYRDKLVKTFDSRGYEKFRNLAKLSRPKRKMKTESREVSRIDKRNECYLVEEVFEDNDDGNVEDLTGLIGEEGFRLGKWKGSTRLLLLDERFADKSIDELPEAIKVFGNFGFVSVYLTISFGLFVSFSVFSSSKLGLFNGIGI